ncbi:MAG: hypothetical protein Q9222_001916 [Ikaeria aurantiellina]
MAAPSSSTGSGSHARPQNIVNKSWKISNAKYPGKVYRILPPDPRDKRTSTEPSDSTAFPENAVVSYDEAAVTCKAKVEAISEACRMMNQKYIDPYWDLEIDFMKWQRDKTLVEDCLVPLGQDEIDKEDVLRPMSVKRVADIFENPQFQVDDGEWIYEIIDDKLYLTKEDYYESSLANRLNWLDKTDPDDAYRKAMQSGSTALYFAKCRNENETWLPLLEKAYAKAHGDYGVLSGGFNGEALEDLTGGVTSELLTTGILDKDVFWNNELMNVNKQYLFGLSQPGGRSGERRGIVEGHSYSIMSTQVLVEEKDGKLQETRLLKIKNPWGTRPWTGPWSDGSSEWTPERMRECDYVPGEDGLFVMRYEDLLKYFQRIDRTRLFGADWSITQQWACANVPWSDTYLDTKFRVRLSKGGQVVLVLSQLDDRYFRGLEGQYRFQLRCELRRDDDKNFIETNKPSPFMSRSVMIERHLEAGDYTVLVKIKAFKCSRMTKPEKALVLNYHARPDKLKAVGRSYDLAHAKGGFEKSEFDFKNGLRRARREKRKSEARKAFEVRRLADKKAKLKRLRAKKHENDHDRRYPGAILLRLPKKITFDGDFMGVLADNSRNAKVIVEIEEIAKIRGSGKPANEHSGGSVSVAKTSTTRSDDLYDSLGPKHAVNAASNLTTTGSPVGQSQSNEGQAPSESSTHQEDTTKAKDDTNQTREQAAASPKELTLDDISDDDLSWSSDVDAPPDSDTSGSDSDYESDKAEELSKSERAKATQPTIGEARSMKEQDPWNAVCVFGLRVYSQESEAKIKLDEAGR